MPRRSDSDEGERDSDVEMQDGTNSGGRGNDKGLKSAKGKGRTIQPHSDDDRGGSYDDDEGRAKVPKQQQRTQAEESASKDEQDEEEEEQLQHDIYGGNQTFDMRQTIEQQRGIKQQLRTQAAEIECILTSFPVFLLLADRSKMEHSLSKQYSGSFSVRSHETS